MPEWAWGVVIWVVLSYPVWSPRCRRIRRQQAQEELQRRLDRVSRNAVLPVALTPAWIQDAPYAECFEEGDEDDDL